MSWPRLITSLLVPGFGFLLRRDALTFLWVLGTVGITYASYHVLVTGYPSAAYVPTSYHYLPVLGGALHLGAAVRAARPEPGRKP